MSSAPGRRELRWFALAAALASLFNLANVLVTVRAPIETVLLASRLSLLFGGLHAVVWFKYSAAQEQRALRGWERAVMAGGAMLSVLSLVPGLVLERYLFARDVPWLGVTYADAPPTTFGAVAFAYHAAGVGFIFARYVRMLVGGRREIATQCVAIGAVFFGAIHDALASSGIIGGPYLLDLAVLVMVLAVAGSLTKSFVASARALETSSRKLALAHEELVKRERLAALGELSAIVAHEVRNPLAVVFNATAGLRKATPGSETHAALVAIIQEEAERLRDIVDDLLEFARPRPPVFALVSVEDIVRSAVDAARSTVGEGTAGSREVVVEVEPGLTPRTCDERLVRQAVVNLVSNALQAPARRGPVRVRIGTVAGEDDDEETVTIEVADDGLGVPEDQRQRVFTPFYSTRPSGTGLGLAVVRSSAQAHGGDVVLTETDGGGATFTVRLPCRRARG
jgi:signal transduction histidine kinase